MRLGKLRDGLLLCLPEEAKTHMFIDSNVVVHIFVCKVVALYVLIRDVLDLLFVPRGNSWGHIRALGEIRFPEMRYIFLFGVIIL